MQKDLNESMSILIILIKQRTCRLQGIFCSSVTHKGGHHALKLQRCFSVREFTHTRARARAESLTTSKLQANQNEPAVVHGNTTEYCNLVH
jgi:hypothetical protein